MTNEIIFIWGMMGVGKSTLGQSISMAMQLDFLDLDLWIEKQIGLNIPQIFNLKGEIGFRQIEHDSLNQIIDSPFKGIFSTGGGTPCYFDNAERMNEVGKTIFVHTDIHVIASRLSESNYYRPLLDNLMVIDYVDYLVDLYEQRKIHYSKAKYQIELTEDLKENTSKLIQIIYGD